MAGFSFGAAVAVRFGCAERRAHTLISPSPRRPIGSTRACSAAAANRSRSFTAISDDVAPLARLERLVAADRIRVIPGADHFFMDHLDALQAAVADAVKSA